MTVSVLWKAGFGSSGARACVAAPTFVSFLGSMWLMLICVLSRAEVALD